MNDVTLDVGKGKFSYRVGALIIDNGELLMVKNENMGSHFYTPGGRVQAGESVHDAVIRELFEETKMEFKPGRLAFIHENFFMPYNRDARYYHEIAMYFIMEATSRARSMLYSSFKADYGEALFEWLPTNKLDEYILFPEFLKKELVDIKPYVRHFVTKNEITTLVE